MEGISNDGELEKTGQWPQQPPPSMISHVPPPPEAVTAPPIPEHNLTANSSGHNDAMSAAAFFDSVPISNNRPMISNPPPAPQTKPAHSSSSFPLPPPPMPRMNAAPNFPSSKTSKISTTGNVANVGLNSQPTASPSSGLGLSSLPPPPKMDHLSLGMSPPPTTSSSTQASMVTSSPSRIVVTAPLPPPPTLSIPISGSNNEGINREPVQQSIVNDSPPQYSTSSAQSNFSHTVNYSTNSSGSYGENRSFSHSTTEQIPPLASAPNSGGSILNEPQLTHDNFGDIGGVDNAPTSKLKTDPAAALASSTNSHLPNSVSGSSWTQWSGNLAGTAGNYLTSTKGAGMSTLLEKAGQLAYSTVGTAADLVQNQGYPTADQEGAPSNDNENANSYSTGSDTAGRNVLGGGFEKEETDPFRANTCIKDIDKAGRKDAIHITSVEALNSMTTPDNSIPPSQEISQSFNKIMETPSESGTQLSQLGEDQGIEIGADGRAPSASPHRTTAEPPSLSASTKIGPPTSPTPTMDFNIVTTPNHPPVNKFTKPNSVVISDNTAIRQLNNRPRASANPPLTTLAARQSRLSILIVGTADAQAIATKNNTTLAEMFRVFGNSHQNSIRGIDPDTSPVNKPGSNLEPPLPPFRSANRSMVLHWDNIVLEFVSNQDMEDMPVSEAESERAIGESARLWDEDRIIVARGVTGVGDEDIEMNELETCVADALVEEEEEERMRKADGIPSMSSSSPSPSNSLFENDAVGDESGTGPDREHSMTFNSNDDNSLQTSANAAFGLTSLPTAPWLQRFRHTLDCSTDGMAHEMFCNPSVVILAASTSEPFLNCLAELANVHHLPRPYHDGRYDPNGLRREFLLLHDVVHGPQQFDETRALGQMRDRFGSGCCSVLRLNSQLPRSISNSCGRSTMDEDAEWESAGPAKPFVQGFLSEEYKPSVASIEKSPIRGAYLSSTDKQSIRRYIANMVATGLVPAVERRIANLNAAVTNAKRGVKNVIKSLWRKPKENILVNVSGYSDHGVRRDSNFSSELGGGGGAARYRFDSIESQARLLADTLFLMRDYEAALSVYRLVKDDYKHDKAMLHYASVQEMIVLCMYQLDPFGRDGRLTSDVHHSIETALYSYTRAADDEREAEGGSVVRPGEAPYATRLATRLCLVLSATRSLCEGKHMEIADLLASASSHETPLGAAVLLEQSSAHYYRARMLRKYAFHMLMAGHMFRSAGQERHAFRSFSASLFVYHGERWEELRSHLRSALAAQLYGMGRYSLAMQFYSKLVGMIGGGRVSVRSQQKFLNHIIDICRDHQSSALIAVDRMNRGLNETKSIGTCAFSGSTFNVDDVLRHFANATREVEIPNVGFPHINDASIRVHVDNMGDSCVSFGRSDSSPNNSGVDQSNNGDELVWQDMKNCAEAELRACMVSKNISNIESGSKLDDPSPPPVHSGNAIIDRVIMEIDKEERNAEYRERQKRKGIVGNPKVRSMSEALTVSFSLSNPLGLEIHLSEMQLVACLASKTGTLHTSEFPVSAKNTNIDQNRTWIFHGSEKEYQTPEFLCQIPLKSLLTELRASAIDHDSGPHFVVTRSVVKMEPNSVKTVSLNICPLTEGDFRILGVRFKLLGEVWIYHQFNLPGPLLQDTRLNRSKRARGESLTLKSKVEQKMPFLKISITPNQQSLSSDPNMHGTVLQGQTSSWNLKLTNLGYAPASNILLKTNAPWLNIVNLENKEKVPENSPTSFCVGPSGTLLKIPVGSSMHSKTIDVLQPGETVEVPVVIRTSGGGRQDFYMLFRYELWAGGDLSSTLLPRHRWTHKLLSVPVYPSITLSASLMPSYSKKGEHILSVELMNYRSDRDSNLEIYLDKIFVASRHFEVRQLIGQMDFNGRNGPTPSSLKIGWQERVTIHYLVVPLERETSVFTLSSLAFSKNKGDLTSSETQPTIGIRHGAQVTDFMCRERANEVFNSTLHSHRIEKEKILAEQERQGQPRHVAQIRRARTSLPKDESDTSSPPEQIQTPNFIASTSSAAAHPTSIACLCPLRGSSNINIICCWSAFVENHEKNETIHGQHHLRNLLVRPQSKSKGCPLALTAKHNSHISHDFNNGPLDIEVEITIRNRLVEAGVEFEFSLDHQTGFDFIGNTYFKHALFGGDETTVPVKARFFSGGVYNLQSVRLTVLKTVDETEMPVPYLFPLQWAVVIQEL